MKSESNPSFLKWTLASRKKRTAIIFFVLFGILGKLYMYTTLAGIPCDGAFLCGVYKHLGELPLLEILAYEFFTFAPFALVLLSFWGLYKRNVLFKATK